MEWGDKRQLNEIKFENKGTKKQKKKRKEGHDVKNEKASLDSFEEKKKKRKRASPCTVLGKLFPCSFGEVHVLFS